MTCKHEESVDSPSILLRDFFERTYRIRRLRGKSENTSRLYRLSIRSFSRTLGREARLSDLTNDNVSWHMQRIMDEGRAKATANKDRQQLLTIWRYACQQGYVSNWPDVPAEPEPLRTPKAWLLDDLKRLFHFIDNLPGYVGDVPARLWWRGVVMVCLDTGERIGAVRQAKWAWLEHDWITIPAEARKGRKRDKQYQLSEATLAAMQDIRRCTGDGEGRIFPWPYNETYIWPRFKSVLKRAGLPHGRRDAFHRLRKTCASVAYQAGLDATDALDHQHRRTTKEHYLDPRFRSESQASHAMQSWLGR